MNIVWLIFFLKLRHILQKCANFCQLVHAVSETLLRRNLPFLTVGASYRMLAVQKLHVVILLQRCVMNSVVIFVFFY